MQEVMTLETRLRVKTAELAALQKKVQHVLIEPQGHTPNSTSLHIHKKTATSTHHINSVPFLKENVVPK